MSSAFGAAGERCLAGSVLVAVGEVAEPLLDLLLARRARCESATASQPDTDMGPLVTADHRNKVVGYIEKGVAEGAKPLCDGRDAAKGEGFFVGPTIFDNVRPEMTIAREEIFGPVLSVIRVNSLDDAIELVNSSASFGNTTSIFTSDGKSAREYAARVEVGMVGVNIGVAAPMAFFPFCGWKRFVLRRFARSRQRRDFILYRTKGYHDPLVLADVGPAVLPASPLTSRLTGDWP